MDRGVVELHALADADGARAQDDDFLPVGADRLIFCRNINSGRNSGSSSNAISGAALNAAAGNAPGLIGRVKIGDVAVKLRGAAVDHLVDGADASLLPLHADVTLLPLPEPGDARVRKAAPLRVEEPGGVAGMHPERLFLLDDVLQLVDEEAVDAGEGRDLRTGLFRGISREIPEAQQRRDGEDPVPGAGGKEGEQAFFAPALEFRHVEMGDAGLQGADRLQKTFFEGASHAHDLSGGLHLRSQVLVRVRELVEGEAGHLGDDVVQRRLKGSGRVRERNLVQSHSDADLRRDPGDGIAAGLGGEGRRAGHPGIHLDQVVLEGLRVQRELHVAAALHLQRPDQLQGRVPEHVVLFVGQGLGGTHDDGISCVDADRIQVLHVADRDGGIVRVPHHFVLDLLVSPDAFFNQHLMDRGDCQGVP